MSAHSGRTLTAAIIAALEAADLVVGDGEKPDGAGYTTETPNAMFQGYVVVHPLLGGVMDGSIANPNEDAYPSYQFTSIGKTREQVELIADRTRTALFAASLTVSGRKVMRVRPLMLPGARRDDQAQPPVWVSPERFDFMMTTE